MRVFEKKGGNTKPFINKNSGSPAVKAVIDKGIASKTWVSQNREPYRDIKIDDKEIKLTLEQRQAVDAILAKEGEYLLHGVTGSGKTEIYMRVIEEQLKRGKTAIMRGARNIVDAPNAGIVQGQDSGKRWHCCTADCRTENAMTNGGSCAAAKP